MQFTFTARPVRSWALRLLLLPLAPAPVVAQVVRELAAGWTSVGPIPTSSGTTYTGGLSLGAAIDGTISQRLRLGVSGTAMFFDRNVVANEPFPALPCPSTGCGRNYLKQPTQLISVGGNGQFNLDSRGRFFVDAGAGEYATFLQMTEFRFGVSGGAGMTIPIGPRLLGTVQADWHGLLGRTSGPRNLFPVSVGLRF